MNSACWDREIREDHWLLNSQRAALKAAVESPVPFKNKWICLWQVVQALRPRMEQHLLREEETLFPALEKALKGPLPASGYDPPPGILEILRHQHNETRRLLLQLGEWPQATDEKTWEQALRAAHELIGLMENHEERESHLLSGLLEFCMGPEQLTTLARQFERAPSKKDWAEQ